MQAARRRAMLGIRRQILSYGGGAVTFVPGLAREIALTSLESVMRVYRLQTLHWTSVPLQWGAAFPPPPQVDCLTRARDKLLSRSWSGVQVVECSLC